MSDACPGRRRAVVFMSLLLAVVLAAGLVSATVALTRTPGDGARAGAADTAFGGAASNGAEQRERGTGGGSTGGVAGIVPAPSMGPTAAVAAPQRGLAAAAVAAASAAAGQAGFTAGAAAAAPVGATVAVLDRDTSETAIGEGGSSGVLSASLSKLVLAVDVLDRRRIEGLPVSDVDVRLIQRALGPSDDAAMSALWSRFDGPATAPRLSARIGLQGTASPRDPSQWGEMVVTASDLLRVWQHLLDGMPTPDRDLVIAAMAGAPARATDGFDQAYGLLAPGLPTEVGAAKQGWMCCIGGTRQLHTVGVVGPGDRFVVALLTTSPSSWGWDAARQLVDRMAVAATQALATPIAG